MKDKIQNDTGSELDPKLAADLLMIAKHGAATATPEDGEITCPNQKTGSLAKTEHLGASSSEADPSVKTGQQSTMNEAKSAPIIPPAEGSREIKTTNTRTHQIRLPDEIDAQYICDCLEQIWPGEYWRWNSTERLKMKAEFCIFFSSVAEEIEQKGRDADPFLLEMGLSAIEGWQDYMLDPTLIVLRDEIWEAQEKLDSKQQTDNPVEKKTSTLCSLTSLKSSK